MGLGYAERTAAASAQPESRRHRWRLWADRRLGIVAAVLVGSGFGVATAWVTPRGPITTTQALITMLAAVVVGLAVGTATAWRWAALVTATAYIGALEMARLGLVGPTVDAIELGSLYGVIAFVLGRLFHGVLVFLPMTLGAVVGIRLARRLGHTGVARLGTVGWTLTGIASAALVALIALLVRPATTAPILGTSGESPPGSIAELTTVEIGGHDQALMIRGRNVENPVLLYLAGGPGGTDLGAMRADVTLEQDFIVVVWDQRGAGRSYAALDPTDTFTLSRLIDDTVQVTEYLRDRFDEDKIYLVGQSWGSTLGVLAAQQRPDLYEAFVGVGQMVSQRETDIIFWDDTLAWAEEAGNPALAETLEDNGPPPYTDLTQYEPIVSHEHDWNWYPELNLDNEMPAILFVPEYSLMDRINAFRGFLDTNATLYPQLQDIDFRQDVPELEIPLFMVLGENEARGRAVLAEEWFDQVAAPTKHRFVFDGAGHRPNFDQPGRFAGVMRQVLAATR